jgi:hypothetical protein
MKTAITAVLAAMALLAVAGWGNRERSATPGRPEPPGVSLHEAVLVGNVQAIRQHIAADSNLDEKDSYGFNPLIVAALLDGGADRYATNNAGRAALDAVSGAFEDAKPIYDELGAALGPLGLKLDYEHIQATRPKVAQMLRWWNAVLS